MGGCPDEFAWQATRLGALLLRCLGCRPCASACIGGNGHKRDFLRRPAHSAVQIHGAAIGALRTWGDGVLLHAVTKTDGTDDPRANVGNDAGHFGALAEPDDCTAFAIGNPATHRNAQDGVDTSANAVTIEHLHRARLKSGHVHRLCGHIQRFVVGLAFPPVVAAH